MSRRRDAWPAWLACLALGVSILLVAGCGERRGGSDGVRLVFRHARLPGSADPLPGLLREFERQNPGVRVENQPLPWTADVQHQFYVINLEGRSAGFDVLMLDVIWVPEFARAGWLLDLTDRVSAAELAEHFPATVAAARFEARLWAVPWVMNVGLLYYRRDLLTRHGLSPPETYEELVRQARVITAAEREPSLHGFLWQGKQYEGLVVNVLESFWAGGTDLLDTEGRVLPDERRAREALAFRRDLLVSGVSPALVTAADEEITRREFGAGRAVFLRNWPYAIGLFDAPDSPVRGRVGIAPLPGDGGAQSGASGGAHGGGAAALGGAHLAVNRTTRHPDAAWALVRFLASPRAQRMVAAAVGLHSTRPALFDDPTLLEIFRRARPRPVTPWYQVLSATLQPELSAAIVGVKSPERALADARLRLAYFLGDGRRLVSEATSESRSVPASPGGDERPEGLGGTRSPPIYQSVWGAMSGPPMSSESRSAGGLATPSQAAPSRARPRSAPAPPGRDERGGFGGPLGPSMFSE